MWGIVWLKRGEESGPWYAPRIAVTLRNGSGWWCVVDAMRPGSVIVDVATEQGGNCELSRPRETVVRNRVTILGPVNLAANVPEQASELYARSVSNFLAICVKADRLEIDPGDEILGHTLVAQGGDVVHPQLRETLGLPPLVATQEA